MTFEKGVPTSVNGKKMKVSDIIRELNRLGGKHGIGIIDIVENRVVGMKSRGVYETPGGTILMEAHKQLEELVLDRATMETKKDMGNKLSQIVYEGNGSLLFVKQFVLSLDQHRNMLLVKLNSNFTKETLLRQEQLLHIHYIAKVLHHLQLANYMITMMLTDSLHYSAYHLR